MNQQHPAISRREEKESQIRRLESQIASLRSDIRYSENNCRHKWEVERDDIYTPGYMIPGDEPGTMGVDWRGPCWVESKTIKRWKRTCGICGKKEYASDANVKTEETPRFD